MQHQNGLCPTHKLVTARVTYHGRHKKVILHCHCGLECAQVPVDDFGEVVDPEQYAEQAQEEEE